MSDGIYGGGYGGDPIDFDGGAYVATYSADTTTVTAITVTAAPNTTNAWSFNTYQGQNNWLGAGLFVGGAAVTIIGGILAGLAGLAGFGAALAALGILAVVVGGVWLIVSALHG